MCASSDGNPTIYAMRNIRPVDSALTKIVQEFPAATLKRDIEPAAIPGP
jgi:hypothetical protein